MQILNRERGILNIEWNAECLITETPNECIEEGQECEINPKRIVTLSYQKV